MLKPADFYLWGYVLDEVPGKMMFVSGETHCSLETAAAYLNCESVCWMNPLHDLALLNENSTQLNFLEHIPNVLCGLTHIEANGLGKGGWQVKYQEAAAQVSRLSCRHRNIQGAIIDDFRSPTGPSKDMTAAELHEISRALKSANPNLKLYLVQYHVTQKPEDLLASRADFDGVMIWSWHATDYFWNALYEDEIRRWRQMYPEKELIQGQFIHAYGDGDQPMPLEQMKLQCAQIAARADAGMLDGWCTLQNGFFCRENHRAPVEYLREYWNWYRATRTVR